ncbi:uncharacterized protein LOC110035636 [Phalaenopsis equestris]|uniref:uncharacterized protein LOC110035636 n=1 Tax=Phalaenopsis equestris TaxID=78828 RepID=UPI0009E3989D|nr:uncharacterized protein LOC110035636 [Phalaenopsis equestris]
MEWWRRMVKRSSVPAAAEKEKRMKDGGGFVQLHDAIQTCEYKDILVMWEMLQNPHTELIQDSKPKQADCKIIVTSSQH